MEGVLWGDLLRPSGASTKQSCHSERSEEPDYLSQLRFLAALGMTQLIDIQCGFTLVPANANMCAYARRKHHSRALGGEEKLRQSPELLVRRKNYNRYL